MQSHKGLIVPVVFLVLGIGMLVPEEYRHILGGVGVALGIFGVILTVKDM
jgi:hypothetical protein